LEVNEYKGANRIVFFIMDNKLKVTKYSSIYINGIVDEYNVPYHQEVVLLKLWIDGFVHEIPRNAVAFKTFSSYYDDYHDVANGTLKPEKWNSKFHIAGMPKASQQKLRDSSEFFDLVNAALPKNAQNRNYNRNQAAMLANTYLFPGGMIVLGERLAYERNNKDNSRISERFLIMSNEYSDDREFNLGSEDSDLVLTGATNGNQLVFKNSENFHPFQQSLSMIYGDKEMSKIILVARGNQRIGLISIDKGNSYEWSKDKLVENNGVSPFETNSSDYLKNPNPNGKLTNISVDVDKDTGETYILEKVIEKPTYSTFSLATSNDTLSV